MSADSSIQLRAGLPEFYSLSDVAPYASDRLVLAIQPFLGIPQDPDGSLKTHFGKIWHEHHKTKNPDLKAQYDYIDHLRIVTLLYECPLVVLEDRRNLLKTTALMALWQRGTVYGEPGYIACADEESFRPHSGFATRFANFLGRFQVQNIDVIGKYDDAVKKYLDELPQVTIDGASQKLTFNPLERMVMTPQRNPTAYDLPITAHGGLLF